MDQINQISPKKEIYIFKASGEKELFSELKLRQSLEKAKATPEIVDKIVADIQNILVDGVKTSDIYSRAFSLLREQDNSLASRYSLKQAIMELGPSGHPFEKYVGELLKAQGFTIDVGVIVQGSCVTHEIDVVAQKEDRHIMVECKFHNQPGIKSDVKIALYVQARFEDVQKQWENQPDHSNKFHEVWLVTNTKLTSDAIKYATCTGMKAIGWNYPLNASLQDLIEDSGLHPITCLTTLDSTQKRQLVDQGIILCKEISNNPDILSPIGIDQNNIKLIIQEIHQLCHQS
jgi:Holliday junction resolvase-like predicted endonuclease